MTTLTVAGGSAASVGTGQGCAGYLFRTGTTSILLDAGPGTLQELRKHTDFRSLDAVVISHLHVDHMLDVLAMRFALAYNPVKPERPVALWLPPGGLEMFRQLATVFDSDGKPDDFFSSVFDVAEYDPDSSLAIGNAVLAFAPTVHFVPCWAIRVRNLAGGGDLVYTADTGPAAHLSDFMSGAHVVVAEATTPESQVAKLPHDRRGHLTAREAAGLATDAGATVLILTHMFEENDPAESIAIADDAFRGEVIRALPGVSVSWS